MGCGSSASAACGSDSSAEASPDGSGGSASNDGYAGALQSGFGPIDWGISMEQVGKVMGDERCVVKVVMNITDTGSSTMRDIVEKIVIPTTVGTGTGYALFSNKSEPLRAKVMVSHAWDEYYRDFALALRKAGSSEEGHSGPFWICAFAIYQPEDIPGLTIAKQLGPDPSRGPFSSVLKSAEAMLCIVTTSCDIYTRMWCVFEMYTAQQLGVPVQMFAFAISPAGMPGIRAGELTNDPIKDTCKSAINTKSARCGHPSRPQSDDEKAIRKSIEAMPGSYKALDVAVEQARLQYLKDTLNSKGLQDRAAMLKGRPFTEDPTEVYREAIETVEKRLAAYKMM